MGDPSTDVLFTIVPILIGVAFVTILGSIIYSTVRRYRVAKAEGLDPWAGDVQLAARAVKGLENRGGTSGPAAPGIEARLHELDDLRSRGVISQAEYDQARARALGI